MNNIKMIVYNTLITIVNMFITLFISVIALIILLIRGQVITLTIDLTLILMSLISFIFIIINITRKRDKSVIVKQLYNIKINLLIAIQSILVLSSTLILLIALKEKAILVISIISSVVVLISIILYNKSKINAARLIKAGGFEN